MNCVDIHDKDEDGVSVILVVTSQVCQRDFANELINRVIAPNIDVSTLIQDKVDLICVSDGYADSKITIKRTIKIQRCSP